MILTPSENSSFPFQFTHPGRGATPQKEHITMSQVFQFTHPGRGATARILSDEIPAYEFQFTHPGRGATVRLLDLCL